jgi:hypothetical protein
MRPYAVPAFFAAAPGVFFVAVGAINFARVSTAEQRTDSRLARIRAGAAQADPRMGGAPEALDRLSASVSQTSSDVARRLGLSSSPAGE